MSDKIVTVTLTPAPELTPPDADRLDQMLADLDAQDAINTESLDIAKFKNRADLVAEARELIIRNAHLRELILNVRDTFCK